MADLAVWQRTIVDEEGNIVPGAEIEVRREEDDSLATLYADRAGETPLANPLAADMSGFVRFFAQGDAYTITAVGAGSTRTWRFDPTGRLQEFDRVSEALNTADGADTLETRKQLGTFSTVAEVQSRHIPAVLESIRTFGRNAPGDGPPLDLVRGSEVPGAVQSADGQWWEDVGYNTITVRIPSQFPTLQAAIDHYSRLPMRQGAVIELLIESGHQPASGISVANGSYSHFYVRYEDAVVLLDPSFGRSGQAFIAGYNAAMPVLACLVNANEQLSNGYVADEGSQGKILPGCGITHCWGTGLQSIAGSHVSANDTIWTDNAINGTTGSAALANGGDIDAQRADFSRSGYYGGQAAYKGTLDARESIADDCARLGFRSRNSGNLDIQGARANRCGRYAILAMHSGTVSARYFEGKDAGEDGCHAISGSDVNASDADFSGAGQYGVIASGGARVDARSTNARKGQNDSTSDFYVNTGGTIVINDDSVGGTRQPPNIPTGFGVIYKNTAPTIADMYFETGSWSPELTSSAPGDLSIEYNYSVGRYVRAGDMVTITFNILTDSFLYTTASGDIRIEGIPFLSVDLFQSNWHGSVTFSNIDKAGYTNFVAELNRGNSFLRIRASGNGLGYAYTQIDDIPSGVLVRINGTITYWRA